MIRNRSSLVTFVVVRAVVVGVGGTAVGKQISRRRFVAAASASAASVMAANCSSATTV